MNKQERVQIIVRCSDYENNYNEIASMGKLKYKLPMIDSYVVEVAPDALSNLQSENHLWSYELDTHITAQMNRVADIIDLNWAHERNITGENVGVAVVDTGICMHKDFTEGKNRIKAFHDLIHGRIEPYDDNGHGSHVSGIIGGSGFLSNGKYTGIAPKCDLIGIKVLDQKGDGNISDVLAGLQWIIDNKVKHNIRVVNISVGTTTKDNADENSLLVKGVNAVWDAGIVVVVAAGNNGPSPMSISTPGISRKVITVGSSDDRITVELFGNKTMDYSGRGPTASCVKKPDIVAPGSNIVSCGTMKNYQRYRYNVLNNPRNDYTNLMYTVKSGTSMATPIVTGAIALLLSVYPSLSNKDVKLKLRDCAIDLGYPWSKQGWGLLNIKRLLQ
ncbi:S8 family peptidase [Clostridium sp. KNHs205]|uniref:S8 family peptidase n=1 Tax=Clostridium sp. KNHs205 TaxID=1449050 RepID=UPI00325BDD60